MKNKIYYAEAAQHDIDDIWDYIVAELQNPIAAGQVTDKIMDTIDSLEDFALLGSLVPSDDPNREFRYLVSGNYMIFYHVRGDDVYIDRVLYGRRDYLRVLFEDAVEETETER